MPYQRFEMFDVQSAVQRPCIATHTIIYLALEVAAKIFKCSSLSSSGGGFSIGWVRLARCCTPLQGLVTVTAGQNIPRLSWLGLAGPAKRQSKNYKANLRM